MDQRSLSILRRMRGEPFANKVEELRYTTMCFVKVLHHSEWMLRHYEEMRKEQKRQDKLWLKRWNKRTRELELEMKRRLAALV